MYIYVKTNDIERESICFDYARENLYLTKLRLEN